MSAPISPNTLRFSPPSNPVPGMLRAKTLERELHSWDVSGDLGSKDLETAHGSASPSAGGPQRATRRTRHLLPPATIQRRCRRCLHLVLIVLEDQPWYLRRWVVRCKCQHCRSVNWRTIGTPYRILNLSRRKWRAVKVVERRIRSLLGL